MAHRRQLGFRGGRRAARGFQLGRRRGFLFSRLGSLSGRVVFGFRPGVPRRLELRLGRAQRRPRRLRRRRRLRGVLARGVAVAPRVLELGLQIRDARVDGHHRALRLSLGLGRAALRGGERGLRGSLRRLQFTESRGERLRRVVFAGKAGFVRRRLFFRRLGSFSRGFSLRLRRLRRGVRFRRRRLRGVRFLRRRLRRRVRRGDGILGGSPGILRAHRRRLRVRDVPLQLLDAPEQRRGSLVRGRLRRGARRTPSLGALARRALLLGGASGLARPRLRRNRARFGVFQCRLETSHFVNRGGVVFGRLLGHGRCRRRGHRRGRRGDARRVGFRLSSLGARLGARGARFGGGRIGDALLSLRRQPRQTLFQLSFPFRGSVVFGGARGAQPRRLVFVPRAESHRPIRVPRGVSRAARVAVAVCFRARVIVDREGRHRRGRVHGVHLDNLRAVLARGTADRRTAVEQVVQPDRGARG